MCVFGLKMLLRGHLCNLTNYLDIVGHPAENDLLMNSRLKIRSCEQNVVFEHRSKLGETAEEENRKRGRQVGQVPGKQSTF